MEEKNLKVVNTLGLHARAAAKLVNVAGQYHSHITLTHKDKEVNGKSIMGVMLLAAGIGSEVAVRVEGEDATDAMQAIDMLFASGFEEGAAE